MSTNLYQRVKTGWIRWSDVPGSDSERRFWAKVNVDGPVHPILKTQCWLWTACRSTHYGFFKVNGRMYYAHRYSWKVHRGDIPHGLCVCHQCDQPLCVNPSHLFLGTKSDNNTDRDAKDRQVKGEKQNFAKLTEEQVREIRRKYRKGCSVNGGRPMAREFGVTQGTIQNIIHGKTWKHVLSSL